MMIVVSIKKKEFREVFHELLYYIHLSFSDVLLVHYGMVCRLSVYLSVCALMYFALLRWPLDLLSISKISFAAFGKVLLYDLALFRKTPAVPFSWHFRTSSICLAETFIEVF